MRILPDRVGDLVRLAVKDLTLCEANPDYTIDMMAWHSYDTIDETCLVCLAGSVLAQSLKIDRTIKVLPSDFDDEVENKLRMLNFCRYYSYYYEDSEWYSSQQVFVNYDKVISSGELFEIARYEVDPVQFKSGILNLADLMDKYDVHYIGKSK